MKQNKANPQYPKLSETSKLISTGIITFGLLFTANAQQDSLKTVVPDSASKAKLHTNYPNPFMPTSSIRFDLDSAAVNDSAVVNLLDFNKNIVAKKVIHVEDPKKKYYSLNFDDFAKNLKAGVYYYELNYKGEVHTNKIVLVK